MQRRRLWLKAALAGAATVLPWNRSLAQQGNSINSAERLGPQHITPLEDQLTRGLRAVRPEQLRFVQIVVAYVNQGKLPRAMVNLVYKWALERNSSIPFPYFQYALRVLAKRRGVNLPAA